MPLYEYHCLACGETFEALVSLNNPRPVRCPNCGSEDVKKGFSTFGVRGGSAPSSWSSSSSSCSTGGG